MPQVAFSKLPFQPVAPFLSPARTCISISVLKASGKWTRIINDWFLGTATRRPQGRLLAISPKCEDRKEILRPWQDWACSWGRSVRRCTSTLCKLKPWSLQTAQGPGHWPRLHWDLHFLLCSDSLHSSPSPASTHTSACLLASLSWDSHPGGFWKTHHALGERLKEPMSIEKC